MIRKLFLATTIALAVTTNSTAQAQSTNQTPKPQQQSSLMDFVGAAAWLAGGFVGIKSLVEKANSSNIENPFAEFRNDEPVKVEVTEVPDEPFDVEFVDVPEDNCFAKVAKEAPVKKPTVKKSTSKKSRKSRKKKASKSGAMGEVDFLLRELGVS